MSSGTWWVGGVAKSEGTALSFSLRCNLRAAGSSPWSLSRLMKRRSRPGSRSRSRFLYSSVKAEVSPPLSACGNPSWLISAMLTLTVGLFSGVLTFFLSVRSFPFGFWSAGFFLPAELMGLMMVPCWGGCPVWSHLYPVFARPVTGSSPAWSLARAAPRPRH